MRAGIVLACWLLFGSVVFAQTEPEAAADSLWTIDLDEVVVRGAAPHEVVPNTLQRVALAAIAQADAASVDGIARLIPAAHVQTNSRGETLVYLRNAGERQVALFFDGALLNVPWDNRFDLSLVPAGVVGAMTVAKGVPSVLYGTNVLGGAVNLTSRRLRYPGRFTEVSGMLGTPEARHVQVTHLGRTERFSYTAALGYDARDGLALPEDADVPFSQPDDDLRTNTDRRLVNAFGQVRYVSRRGVEVGVSVLHVDAEKGVAPEGHLDPDLERVRFWRYPDWRTTLVLLSGQFRPPGRGALLRGAVWGHHFAQTIDQYASVRYDDRAVTQDDDDRTGGARLTLVQPTGSGELRLALNALTSEHRQRERDVDAAGMPSPAPTFTYRQHVWSVGGEYEWAPARRLGLLVGSSLDGLATPDTGDKPARDPEVAVGVSTGLVYDVQPGWTARVAAGRKVRFPTMRELFGEALGRFLVNDDLRPESSLTMEAGVVVRHLTATGELTAFAQRTFDTIDQESVQVPGEERSRRRRINLDGSRVVGVEAVGALQPAAGWTVEGHVTWLRARGLDDGALRRLAEKPAWLGTLTLEHRRPGGFAVLLQTVGTGVAYSPDPDDVFQKLPASLVVNARTGYRLTRTRTPTVTAEAFIRVNNVTDAETLPQLGLPGPGRELYLGLDVSF